MDVRLILDSGNQKGRETSLSRGIYLVGRSRICQIRPKNRYVSRKHCAIIHRKREVLIQDLGSRTGTYINRVRIDPKVATTLNDGDKIRVGKTKFRVAIVLPQPAQGAEETPGSDEYADEELAFAPDEGSDPQAKTEGKQAALVGSPQVIGDVLRMLEEDDEEDDAESPSHFVPGSVFRLSSNGNDIDVDDEDDSDGNVVFAAPKSGESLGCADPLPSYASRKDWDVKSVYSWIEQKETFARLDERRVKRKAGERKQNVDDEKASDERTLEADDKYTPQQREAQRDALARAEKSKATAQTQQKTWINWIDSDTARPIVFVAVGVAFVAWIAWNAWLLISFKG